MSNVFINIAKASFRVLSTTPGIGPVVRRARESLRPQAQLPTDTGVTSAQLLAQIEALTRAQTGETSKAIASLEQRFEFVRLELMYEIQHYLSANGTTGAHKVALEPKIVNHDKVAASSVGDYHLNIGCGHKPIDGLINVDLRPLPGVDITATADNIPLEAGSCAAIRSSHLMEHFMEEDLKRRILPHWFELLKSGGTLSAVVPDAASMMRAWAKGDMDFETLRLITYGQQEYDGDFHFTMFSPQSMGALFEAAGFVDVKTIAEGRKNGLCLEFEITATRP